MRNVITLHFASVHVPSCFSVPLVKTGASGGRLTTAHQRQGYRGNALISQPQPEGPRGERDRRQSLSEATGLVVGAALPMALQCDGGSGHLDVIG